MFKKSIVGLLVAILIQLLLLPQEVGAQTPPVQCETSFSNYVQSSEFLSTVALNQSFNIKVNFNNVADTNLDYFVQITNYGDQFGPFTIGNISIDSDKLKKSPEKPSVTFTIPSNNTGRVGVWRVTLKHDNDQVVCQLGIINFYDESLNQASCNIVMPNNVQQDQPFYFKVEKRDVSPDVNYILYFLNKASLTSLPKGLTIVAPVGADLGMSESAYIRANPLPIVRLYTNKAPEKYILTLPQNQPDPDIVPPNLGYVGITYSNSGSERLPGGEYTAVVEVQKKPPGGNYQVFYCSSHDFTVSSDLTSSLAPGTPVTQSGTGGTIGGGELKTETCIERARKDPNVKCAEAKAKPCDDNPQNPGIQTAIGCIHTSPVEFTKDALKFLIGIGGGFAFLMMLLGAFQMLTSAGNPETLQAGRDRLTSAIIGLLIVIFAILLMQIIGFDILKIPEFGR